MKKTIIALLTVAVTMTGVLIGGTNIHKIGDPGRGTGTRIFWSCLLKATETGIVLYRWSRTPWGTWNQYTRTVMKPVGEKSE